MVLSSADLRADASLDQPLRLAPLESRIEPGLPSRRSTEGPAGGRAKAGAGGGNRTHPGRIPRVL